MDDVIELAYGKQLTLKKAAWKSCVKDPSEAVHRFHCNNKPCACRDSEKLCNSKCQKLTTVYSLKNK